MVNRAKKLRVMRASVIALVILAASFTYVNGQAGGTPESRVMDFYTWYLKAMAKGKDATKNKTVTSSHLSDRFSRWYYSKAGQTTEAGIFYNKGDWKRAWADNIEIGESFFTDENHVVVKIQLSSPPDEFVMKLQVFLVKEGGKWKIDRVAGLFD